MKHVRLVVLALPNLKVPVGSFESKLKPPARDGTNLKPASEETLARPESRQIISESESLPPSPSRRPPRLAPRFGFMKVCMAVLIVLGVYAKALHAQPSSGSKPLVPDPECLIGNTSATTCCPGGRIATIMCQRHGDTCGVPLTSVAYTSSDPGRFLCGSAVVVPATCPPGQYLSSAGECTRCNFANGRRVDAKGAYCPGGIEQRSICPAGSFCTFARQITCPSGSICPEGSHIPTSCSLPSLQCTNTGQAAVENGLAVLAAAVFILLILWAVVRGVTYYFLERDSVIGQALLLEYRRREHQFSSRRLESTTATWGHAPEKNLGALPGVSVPAHVSFTGLSLRLRGNGLRILNGVTGSFPAGKMTAVMGISGCGKTSLLSVLRGQASYGHVSGKIELNGEIITSLSEVAKATGYAPQEDIMYDDLTVEQNLWHSMRVFGRTGSNGFRSRRLATSPFSGRSEITTSPSQKLHGKTAEAHLVINSVLRALHIDHIRRSAVGSPEQRGISGGQRKRVSIAMEVVKTPRILLLDEPTSGLDSASTIHVLDALRELSQLNVTTVATIHQPRFEVFEAFDNLLLLVPGGDVVYSGPTMGVKAYFASIGYTCPPEVNVADFIIDVTAGLIRQEGLSPNQPVEAAATQRELVAFWKARSRPKRRVYPINPARAEAIEVATPPPSCIPETEVPGNSLDSPSSINSKGGAGAGVGSTASAYHPEALHTPDHGTDLDTGVLHVGAQLVTEPSESRFADTKKAVVLFLKQTRSVLHLQLLRWLFHASAFFIDLSTVLFLGIVLGQAYPSGEEAAGPATLGCSLVAFTMGCRQWGDKLQYRRELESGLHPLAYFLGKLFANSIQIILMPLLFAGGFVGALAPRGTLKDYFEVLLSLWFCATGFGALLTVSFKSSIVTTVGSSIIIVMYLGSGVSGITQEELESQFSWFGILITRASFTSYVAENFVTTDWLKMTDYVYQQLALPIAASLDVSADDRESNFEILALIGSCLYAGTFLSLLAQDRTSFVGRFIQRLRVCWSRFQRRAINVIVGKGCSTDGVHHEPAVDHHDGSAGTQKSDRNLKPGRSSSQAQPSTRSRGARVDSFAEGFDDPAVFHSHDGQLSNTSSGTRFLSPGRTVYPANDDHVGLSQLELKHGRHGEDMNAC